MNKDITKEYGLYFGTGDNDTTIGLNNAHIHSFQDRPYYRTARETIQNSNDATENKDKPVKISIYINEVPTTDIPGHKKLLEAWEKSFEEEKKPHDIKTKEIYENAIKTLKNPKISILTIRDENTIGLEYDEKDMECAFFDDILYNMLYYGNWAQTRKKKYLRALPR